MTQEDRVIVSRSAIDRLKKHYQQLCVKAGLCESVGGRLYTKTFGDAPLPKAEQEPVDELNGWTVFNGGGAAVIENTIAEVARDYMDGTRKDRGWRAVFCHQPDSIEEIRPLFAAPQPKAQPQVPEGYALIGIDALKAWGKYDEVMAACQYKIGGNA